MPDLIAYARGAGRSPFPSRSPACAALLSAAVALFMGAAEAQTVGAPAHIPPGADSVTLKGAVTGREDVAHRIGAEAGHRLKIALRSPHPQAYFNLYAPGQAPGGPALAVGSRTDPLNAFDAELTISGTYTILVHLDRAAARRGETAPYALEVTLTGEPGQVVKGDYADGLMGGPDWWAVRLKTQQGRLRLRAGPSAGADVLGRLPHGTPLRNLGCRMREGRRWCEVETTAALKGWVAGDFLMEGPAPD